MFCCCSISALDNQRDIDSEFRVPVIFQDKNNELCNLMHIVGTYSHMSVKYSYPFIGFFILKNKTKPQQPTEEQVSCQLGNFCLN